MEKAGKISAHHELLAQKQKPCGLVADAGPESASCAASPSRRRPRAREQSHLDLMYVLPYGLYDTHG